MLKVTKHKFRNSGLIAMALLAALFGGVLPSVGSAQDLPPEPFMCAETAYVIQGNGTNLSWLTEIDQSVSPFVFNQIPDGSTDYAYRINNLGFNPADGLLYAWRIPSNGFGASLLTIDAAGTIDLLGVPTGMPTVNPAATLNSGDVSSTGTTMFLTNSGGYGNGNLYVVALTTLTLDATLPIQDSTGGTQLGRVNDFAYNPADGLLYGGDQTDGELAILDPATGIRTDVPLAGLPVDGSPLVRYGGAYFGSDGTLYLYENVSGSIYPVSNVTGTPTLGTAISGMPSTDVDAASCSAVADLSLQKDVDIATPELGSNVVFTIVVTNDGPSDATGVSVSDLLPLGYNYVSDDQGNDLADGTWDIGALANGASATINVTAQVLASGENENYAQVATSDQLDPDSTPGDDSVDQDDDDTVTLSAVTAVDLAAFAAEAAGSDILVTWETAAEIENLGFNLYRAESANGPRIQLNASLIPAQVPGSPVGARYQFRDEAVEPGVTYYYWLEDVDTLGNTTQHGPVHVDVIYRVYVPMIAR